VTAFDRRVTPARPDLAASHLRGKVEAARYADGTVMRVIDVSAPLRNAPTPEASLDTEALHGEIVTVYEQTEEGWSWGQLARDGYVGWLPSNALATETDKATHRVRALRTFVFPRPDIKSPPIASFSFGSELVAAREEAGFVVERSGGFIPKQHVVSTGFREIDPVGSRAAFSARPISGAGKPPPASIARGSCNSHCKVQGVKVRATATCSRRSASSFHSPAMRRICPAAT
jgi:hypothetical protein